MNERTTPMWDHVFSGETRVEMAREMASSVIVFLLSLLLVSLPLTESKFPFPLSDLNGGTNCAACSVLLGLADQLAEIYNETIADSMSRFCNYLPNGFKEACTILVEEYGPSIIALIEEKETPDTACYGIGFCKHQTGAMCHLFPLPSNSLSSYDEKVRVDHLIKMATRARGRPLSFPKLCSYPVIKEICDIIDIFANDHEPLIDVDGDGFSDTYRFRGAYWRGKDCNDIDKQVYPGRSSTDDAIFDTNCNGIMGIDPSTRMTYEEQWCNGTVPMGTVVLGDSAGAHFHIPPSWLTAKELNIDTFSDLLMILENEFDWPMLSFTTGYESTSKWPMSIQGPMESIYSKMRGLNRCNHRDFQNIAVNGARSSSMKDTIVKSFARHKLIDKPAMISLELIGNDVCNGHHDLDHMTTPEEYFKNMHATLEYLDNLLPQGSVILPVGLADGRILYDTLKDHIHPIGNTRGDVTYSTFYDYLNCLEVSPCFGWMNSNGTWRNLTSERAMELTNTLNKLVTTTNYTNIKVYLMPQPLKEVFSNWKGDPADLIEPVDGFHPNQLSNALIANITWHTLQKLYPQVIPPVNPFNHLIEAKFGNQGGY